MISFITNYDEATSCNYGVYRRSGISPEISLLEGDATSQNLISELRKATRNVFAMSHGNDNKLCDQNGMDTFTESNFPTFANSPLSVFAYACNTSNSLGKVAAENNIKWFGFFEPINPPEADSSLVPMYSRLFNYIYSNFPQVSCVDSANLFLEGLKSECDNIREDVDATILSDGSQPLVSTYISIKQLWEKQKIWLTETSYVVHPNAPDPLLW